MTCLGLLRERALRSSDDWLRGASGDAPPYGHDRKGSLTWHAYLFRGFDQGEFPMTDPIALIARWFPGEAHEQSVF
jgi:hypothetical protein